MLITDADFRKCKTRLQNFKLFPENGEKIATILVTLKS